MQISRAREQGKTTHLFLTVKAAVKYICNDMDKLHEA